MLGNKNKARPVVIGQKSKELVLQSGVETVPTSRQTRISVVRQGTTHKTVLNSYRVLESSSKLISSISCLYKTARDRPRLPAWADVDLCRGSVGPLKVWALHVFRHAGQMSGGEFSLAHTDRYRQIQTDTHLACFMSAGVSNGKGSAECNQSGHCLPHIMLMVSVAILLVCFNRPPPHSDLCA